jgi:hypothetical protein
MKTSNVVAYPNRRIDILVLFLLITLPSLVRAQINAYAKVTAISGATLTLSNINQSYDNFGTGKQVILLQMQDNVIGSYANNSTFGTIGAISGAGFYEVMTVSSFSGSTMTLSATPVHTYNTAASVQIVSFNKLATGNYTLNTNLTAVPWNGNVGGVIAFQVGGTLTMKKSVNADGLGFRGGALSSDYEVSCEPGVYDNTSSNYGYKGEGIHYGYYGTHTARGPLASGGGGGSDDNGGGGGGSNVTAGGQGGAGWTCTMSNESGGLGGVGLSTYINGGRVFLGGGGGGGQQNNDLGTAGGAGGGLIFIQANELTTNCSSSVSISANGDTPDDSGNDGAGGAGAGGTIFLNVKTFSVPNSCKLNISSNGGDGGNVTDANSHGGGGGGGQGAVLFSASLPTSHITTSTKNGAGGNNNSSGSSTADDGSGSNGVGVMPSQFFPLPVEFVSLNAEKSTDQNILNWTVGRPAASVVFAVQRSADGTQYNTIGTVMGSSEDDSYTFADLAPLNGKNFYRVQQTDENAVVIYSTIVTIDRSTDLTAGLRFYPNPANKSFMIGLPGVEGTVTVMIRDLSGATVYRQAAAVAGGRATITNIGSVTPGIYLIRVETKDGVQTGKLILH